LQCRPPLALGCVGWGPERLWWLQQRASRRFQLSRCVDTVVGWGGVLVLSDALNAHVTAARRVSAALQSPTGIYRGGEVAASGGKQVCAVR
jgi:hypothetical protein